jgi:superfamily II DNA/RNA helicase
VTATISSTSQTTTSFRDLGVPKKLDQALRAEGITAPFPIQARTVPAALEGRDLCGKAPTGSGKTLAFAIPLVENATEGAPKRPTALVLVPTRELATQIRDVVLPLAKARGRRVASFTGGTNLRRDVERLRRGVDIAVATPGRLADLVQRGDIHLDAVRVVVLDEADRMADMGFLPEVKRLLDRTADDRQTLLFSATLDGDIDVLVRRYQRDPVRVELDVPAEEKGDVTHRFVATDRQQRRDVTRDLLRDAGPTIVFTRTKHGADRLAKQLGRSGIATAAIHGNRSQNQRDAALRRFASGEVTALIATDVAARGIHVDDVALVLHFDLPATDKDYVHRSGRTGRAGSDGRVVSLVCEDQHDDARTLQRALSLPQEIDGAPRSNGNANGNGNGGSKGGANGGPSGDARPRGGARPANRLRRSDSGSGQRRR